LPGTAKQGYLKKLRKMQNKTDKAVLFFDTETGGIDPV
jgi:uncharacterized protein YprB with RNaseH-like and TPR domain